MSNDTINTVVENADIQTIVENREIDSQLQGTINITTLIVDDMLLIDLLALEDIAIAIVVTSSGYNADSGNPSAFFGKVIGISNAAILANNIGKIVTDGEVTYSGWSWTRGTELFLNGTAISATAPSTGFIQRIGTAKNATTIVLEISQPILL